MEKKALQVQNYCFEYKIDEQCGRLRCELHGEIEQRDGVIRFERIAEVSADERNLIVFWPPTEGIGWEGDVVEFTRAIHRLASIKAKFHPRWAFRGTYDPDPIELCFLESVLASDIVRDVFAGEVSGFTPERHSWLLAEVIEPNDGPISLVVYSIEEGKRPFSVDATELLDHLARVLRSFETAW